MAIIVKTHDLTPESFAKFPKPQQLWIYNGLDCMLTHEVAQVLLPKVEADRNASIIYNFERALQGPFLEMMIRGFYIDANWRADLLVELEARATKLEALLNRFSQAVWERDLNASSPKQLKKFFYEYLKLPVQYNRKKGKKIETCDEDALRALKAHFLAKPFCTCILAIRGLWKLYSTLASGVDDDGRMRASFNIAGTETGRASSSENAFGSGTNFQNITEELRRAFIPKPGWKLGCRDLEQAESRLAGLISWLVSGKDNYLKACDSGDLHTTVTKMVRPELAWTGELKHDKQLAETKVPGRHKSYRDYSKNLGHGTNYYGKPFTLSRIVGVEQKDIEEFQLKYFTAFPELSEWHQWTATRLQVEGSLTTPLGRKRFFFGRLGDDATLREGIAYSPQSSIADYMDLGIYLCWADTELRRLGFEIIAQVHDALVFQYNPQNEREILARVKTLLAHECIFNERKFSIPSDCKVGWNWGKANAENEFGLKAWNGTADTRLPPQESNSAFSMLDRRVR